MGNKLETLYAYLRQSDWDQSVLPLTIYIAVLMAVGISGNVIVILVYAGKPRASRTTSLILGPTQRLVVCLAVLDLLLCATAMPGQLARAWYMSWQWDMLCKLFELAMHTTLPPTAVFLVAIAHDRHTLLCRPTCLPSPDMARRRFALTLAVATVLGLCFGVPPALSVGVYQPAENGTMDYYGLCEVNGIIMSQYSLHVYRNVLVSFYLLVLILLLIMYSAILSSVCKHAAHRNLHHQVLVYTAPTCTTSPNLPPLNSDFSTSRWGKIFLCQHCNWNDKTVVGYLQTSHGLKRLWDFFTWCRGRPDMRNVVAMADRKEYSRTNFASFHTSSTGSLASGHIPLMPMSSRDRNPVNQKAEAVEVTCSRINMSSLNGSKATKYQTEPMTDQAEINTSVCAVSYTVYPPTREISNVAMEKNKLSPIVSSEGKEIIEETPSGMENFHLWKDNKSIKIKLTTSREGSTYSRPKGQHQDIKLTASRSSWQETRAATKKSNAQWPRQCTTTNMKESCGVNPNAHSSSEDTNTHSSATACHQQSPIQTSFSNSGKITVDQEQCIATASQELRREMGSQPINAHRLQCHAHVKTAAMFFLVAMTFLVSYVPTFCMMMDVVSPHPLLYHTYFLHAVLNPLIYSAANKQFRTSAKKLIAGRP